MSEDPLAPEDEAVTQSGDAVLDGGGGMFGTIDPWDVAKTIAPMAAFPAKQTWDTLSGYAGVNETQDPGAAVPPPENGIAEQTSTALRQTGDPQIWTDNPGVQRGGASVKGSVQVTASPPIPQELLDAQRAYLGGSADLQAAYHTQRANALGIMVNIGQEFAHGLQTETQKTLKDVDTLLTKAEREANAIDDLVEAAVSNRVNPGQFFANVGAAGRFSAALAVAGGAASAAVLGGGPNHAYNIVTRAIDRNVRAQVANQVHDRAMISHQINLVNTFRGLSNDRAQYGNYVRLGLAGIAKAKMGIIANQLGQVQSQLAARDVYMRLGAYLVEQQIKAISNMTARYTYQFKNASQLQRINQMAGIVSQAKPIAASRGRKTGGTGTKPDAAVQTALKDAEQRWMQTQDPDQTVQAAISSLTAQRGGQVTKEDKAALIGALSNIPGGDAMLDTRRTAIANAASKVRSSDFRGADVVIPVGPESDTFGFRIKTGMEEFHKKHFDPEAYAELSNASQNLEGVQRLEQLLRQGATIRKNKGLFTSVVVDAVGDVTLKEFQSKSEKQRQAIVDQLSAGLLKQWHIKNSGNARNAMNLEWERAFAEKGSNLQTSLMDLAYDAMTNDVENRIARLGNFKENAAETLRSVAGKYGLEHRIVR